MDALDPQLLGILLAAVTALALLQTLRLWWGELGPRLRERRRARRAAEGEAHAQALLSALGYTVEAAQATQAYTLRVDGAAREIALRADYLVTKDGRRYVAEVKTGNAAPQVATAATRRQLLEYRMAYPVDGVLLVNMEAHTAQQVEFPLADIRGIAETGRDTARLRAFLWGAAVGLAASISALLALGR